MLFPSFSFVPVVLLHPPSKLYWPPVYVGNPALDHDTRSANCGYHVPGYYPGVDYGTPTGQNTFILFLSSNRILESNPNRIYRVDTRLSFKFPWHIKIFHTVRIDSLIRTALLLTIGPRGARFVVLVLLGDLAYYSRIALLYVPLSSTMHNMLALCIPGLNGSGPSKLCIVLPIETASPPPWAMLFVMSPSTCYCCLGPDPCQALFQLLGR